ncbi:MAG: hypothetical protein VB106_00535 [Clostridiaceae bacterium]|jgi:hypothetical protein|nr:hypothetical protein [Clostridiaceae bacterium]
MKKTRFIALALVVAIMLMGAGYAVWSDKVSLKTTVKTGNFDMEITKLTTRTGDNQEQNEAHDWHQYDWTHSVNAEILNPNEAIVEFSDMYPGGTVQVDMTMTNKGSIPAKLKSIDVEFLGGNQDLFNLLRAQTSWKADINGDGTIEDMSKYGWGHVEWNVNPWYQVPGALNALVNHLNSYNIVIEPDGSLALGDGTEDGCIKFKLDSSAGNEFQDKNCRFKITFNWEQWASDPTDNPYDGANGYGGDGDI